jgi:phosphotransferase family enzyme
MTGDPLPKAADPTYLTGALRRCGLPGGSRVGAVVVRKEDKSLLSRIIRLGLEYDGSAGDAPASLILKTGIPNIHDGVLNLGRQEVAFYTTIAPSVSVGLVPRCFDAECDGNTWHVLLEDLTDSHDTPTIWPLPPTIEQCEQIIDAWARFHAAWWDDPRLGETIGVRADADSTEKYVRDLAPRVAAFADHLGDRLSPARRELYERFLGAAPRLLGRLRSHRNVTMIHGDAHVWNVFLPRERSGTVRLFDWSGWRVAAATNDLAYMMATHWYPDRRRIFEHLLLDRYHAALLANGVRGYDRGTLADDYRLSVLMHIATPVRMADYDLPPVIWWGHLERIMLAIDDLGCREFL